MAAKTPKKRKLIVKLNDGEGDEEEQFPQTPVPTNIEQDIDEEEQFQRTKNTKRGPVIYIIFNQKGGIGKTTHSSNIAAMHAAKGRNVLIVDADPQCDTTKIALYRELIMEKYKGNYQNFLFRKLDDPTEDEFPRSLHGAFNDYTKGRDLMPIHCISLYDTANGGETWLLPGHPRLSHWDGYISRAISDAGDEYSTGKLNAQNFFGYPNAVIQETAKNLYKKSLDKKITADVVIIDVSSNPGRLNGLLFMSSHFAIMPTILDFMTVLDTETMMETIQEWHKIAKRFIHYSKKGGKYPFPKHDTKILGYIMGRYKTGKNGILGEKNIIEVTSDRNQSHQCDLVAKNIDHMAKEINSKMKESFEELRKLDPPLTLANQSMINLANFREFNRWGPLSQLSGVPICFLQIKDLVHYRSQGVVEKANRNKEDLATIADFHARYEQLVENIDTCSREAGFAVEKGKPAVKELNHRPFGDPIVIIKTSHKKKKIVYEEKGPTTPPLEEMEQNRTPSNDEGSSEEDEIMVDDDLSDDQEGEKQSATILEKISKKGGITRLAQKLSRDGDRSKIVKYFSKK